MLRQGGLDAFVVRRQRTKTSENVQPKLPSPIEHADKEGDIVPGSTIASVSLGAKRRFKLRHEQTKETKELWLEPGSLLLMQGDTQKHYKHCVPKSRTVVGSRINLTFRLVSNTSG